METIPHAQLSPQEQDATANFVTRYERHKDSGLAVGPAHPDRNPESRRVLGLASMTHRNASADGHPIIGHYVIGHDVVSNLGRTFVELFNLELIPNDDLMEIRRLISLAEESPLITDSEAPYWIFSLTPKNHTCCDRRESGCMRHTCALRDDSTATGSIANSEVTQINKGRLAFMVNLRF